MAGSGEGERSEEGGLHLLGDELLSHGVGVDVVVLQKGLLRLLALHEIRQQGHVGIAGGLLKDRVRPELHRNSRTAKHDGDAVVFAFLDGTGQIGLDDSGVDALKNVVGSEGDDDKVRIAAGFEVILQALEAVLRLAAGDAEIERGHARDLDQGGISLFRFEAVPGGDAVAQENDGAAGDRNFPAAALDEQDRDDSAEKDEREKPAERHL